MIQARRQQPDVDATLRRYQQELRHLSAATDAQTHFRRLCLGHSIGTLQMKQNPIRSLQIKEELARIDVQLANAECNMKRTSPVMQIPATDLHSLAGSVYENRELYKAFGAQQNQHDQMQREMRALDTHLLAWYCARLSDEECRRMVQQSIDDLQAQLNAHLSEMDAVNGALDKQREVVDRLTADLSANDVDSRKVASDLSERYRVLNTLEQKRFAVQAERGARRIAWTNGMTYQLYTNDMLMVFDFVSKAYLFCALYLLKISIPCQFQKALSCFESFALVLCDAQTDPAVLRDFVGFVIDFVAFKDGYDDLASKAQHALAGLLLTAIFKTHSSCQRFCAHLTSRGIAFDAKHIVSLERYQAANNTVPLGLALNPERGIHALTEFLQPIGCRVVQSMLEAFIVVDTDDYALGEAVAMFRRHAICARTGFYKFYEDHTTNIYLGLDTNGSSVFRLLADLSEERGRFAAQIDEWDRESKSIGQQIVDFQEPIGRLEMQSKRLELVNIYKLIHSFVYKLY